MIRKICKKSIALLLAAIVVSAAVLSFYYISAEIFHKCDEDHCPVCKVIEISGALVRKVSSAVSVFTASAVTLLITVIIFHWKILSRSADSLISMKVRLNN